MRDHPMHMPGDKYCKRCEGMQRTSPNAVPCTRCGGTGFEPKPMNGTALQIEQDNSRNNRPG